jgi:hypothetical protein
MRRTWRQTISIDEAWLTARMDGANRRIKYRVGVARQRFSSLGARA